MFKLSTASLHVVLSTTLSALASFAVTSPSVAQSTSVVVNVPFAFQTNLQHFKPGVYRFQVDHDTPLMRILGNSQSGQTLFVPDDAVDPSKNGKVVFHRYGSQYFLREVWPAESKRHVHTLPSVAEKQLQLAANATLPKASTGDELAVIQAPR